MATETETDFDLYHLITDELDSSAVADPHIIAEHVAKRVPDEHLRDALDSCLHNTVRQVIHSRRFAPPPSDNTSDAAPTKGQGRTASAKVDLQVWYRRTLHSQLEVGDDEREWKLLADCTRDDVLRAAAQRYKLAEANRANGDRLTALADTMAKHKAKTVADLNPAALAEIMR